MYPYYYPTFQWNYFFIENVWHFKVFEFFILIAFNTTDFFIYIFNELIKINKDFLSVINQYFILSFNCQIIENIQVYPIQNYLYIIALYACIL